MKTTIDNNLRVFQIVRLGFCTRSFFCNLNDIPNVIENGIEKNDQFKIYHFFGAKSKALSKKYLNTLFEANGMTYRIK